MIEHYFACDAVLVDEADLSPDMLSILKQPPREHEGKEGFAQEVGVQRAPTCASGEY